MVFIRYVMSRKTEYIIVALPCQHCSSSSHCCNNGYVAHDFSHRTARDVDLPRKRDLWLDKSRSEATMQGSVTGGAFSHDWDGGAATQDLTQSLAEDPEFPVKRDTDGNEKDPVDPVLDSSDCYSVITDDDDDLIDRHTEGTDSGEELTLEQEQEITEVFESFDVDGSEEMHAGEFLYAVRALGFDPKKEDIQRMLGDFDIEEDDTFGYDDFLQMVTPLVATREPPKKNDYEKLDEQFEKDTLALAKKDELLSFHTSQSGEKEFDGKPLKFTTKDGQDHEGQDERDYDKPNKQLGKCLVELLRFHTSMSGDERISLKEYVNRMKETQSYIYHISGRLRNNIFTSPSLRKLREEDFEVLFLMGPEQEYAVQQMEEFDGKRLKSATEVAELLWFHTSMSGDEVISLKEYVNHMKDGQHDIYYVSGWFLSAAFVPPFLENLRVKGFEVLYLMDSDDEYIVRQMEEFGGIKLKSAMEDEDETKHLPIAQRIVHDMQKAAELHRFHTSKSREEQISLQKAAGMHCFRTSKSGDEQISLQKAETHRFHTSKSGEEQISSQKAADMHRFRTSKSGGKQISLQKAADASKSGEERIRLQKAADTHRFRTSKSGEEQISLQKAADMRCFRTSKSGDEQIRLQKAADASKPGAEQISLRKAAELLRFHTNQSGDEQISLKEYVERMEEGQEDIFYTSDVFAVANSSSPCLEDLRKKWYEVLYLKDPVEEYTLQQMKEFVGKKLKATAEGGLNPEDEDEKKRTCKELKAEIEPLTTLMMGLCEMD